MNADSPWITLFSRESQKAKIARFQIGLVEKEENADVLVSLLSRICSRFVRIPFKANQHEIRAAIGFVQLPTQNPT